MKNLLLLGLVFIPALSFAQKVESSDFAHLIEKDKQILLGYYTRNLNLSSVTEEEQEELKKLEEKYRTGPKAFRTAKSMEMFFKIYPHLQNPGLDLSDKVTQKSKTE